MRYRKEKIERKEVINCSRIIMAYRLKEIKFKVNFSDSCFVTVRPTTPNSILAFISPIINCSNNFNFSRTDLVTFYCRMKMVPVRCWQLPMCYCWKIPLPCRPIALVLASLRLINWSMYWPKRFSPTIPREEVIITFKKSWICFRRCNLAWTSTPNLPKDPPESNILVDCMPLICCTWRWYMDGWWIHNHQNIP